MNTLSLHNDDEESVIAKYRSKVKEDKTINVNNWDKRFDKLNRTRSEEQDSSEIDNLKNMLKNLQLMKTVKFTIITTKTDYCNYH